MCIRDRLISMVTEKNNMHDIDTFMFFKWFFKAWVAVYLVTHTFTITMAVFDMAQHVVSGAAGVIGGNTNIDVDAALSSMQAGLDAMEILSLIHIFSIRDILNLPRWYISESDYQRTCSDILSGLFLFVCQ